MGEKATLRVQLKPKGKKKVNFQQRVDGSWNKIASKKTNKKGRAKTNVQPTADGKVKVRAVAQKPKVKSKTRTLNVSPTPVPPPPPPPPPPPVDTTIAATWPSGASLEVDKDYPIGVKVQPENKVAVQLQTKVGAGNWQDLPRGSTTTKSNGRGTIMLNQPVVGSVKMRVVATGAKDPSSVDTTTFTDGGDTLYNVPVTLPSQTGKLVKAQARTMTYPKVPIKNPLDPTQDLIVPKIGTPAAGPPDCVTDPAVARADCPIPGKQYRFMYTTERWVPNSTGGGKVQGPPEAATGLLMVPENVQPNAKVVAWGHPTLGQADQCSISRGVDPIPKANPVTGGPAPGGQDTNLIDMVFFLDEMLAKGYIVVMPDYLGIAVNGPTSQQKTYVVGPQEARDMYFAVQALKTPAKPDLNWPGLPEAGDNFVAMGHSQGGHAALWTGILSDELGPRTNLNLKGVIAAAPATDLNMLVQEEALTQVNWILGPEVIQTFAGYLPEFALANNVLTQAGMDNVARFTQLCTTQALVASAEFFPNGMDAPGTPFMQDPADPKYAQAFLRWSKVFSAQIPVIEPGQPNSFPTDMPLHLISGTADNIVLSQANAAFQESFCTGGANMSTYWTPVMTGVANPAGATSPSSTQAADHINVLAFPFGNNVGTDKDKVSQISAGSVLEFTEDRFAGKQLDKNCADRAKEHSFKVGLKTIDSWYIFPQLEGTSIKPQNAKFYETNGTPDLVAPFKVGEKTSPGPALGVVDVKSLPPKNKSGCGLPYIYQNLVYKANPDCTEWGLYPYDKLIYPDADVDKKTWGTYPFTPALLKTKAIKNRSKLHINVNPDLKDRDYKVKVQKKKKNGNWKKVKTTRTQGAKDIKVLNRGKGKYRVVMPVQKNNPKMVSKSVKLKR